jgi:hypothetical protein
MTTKVRYRGGCAEFHRSQVVSVLRLYCDLGAQGSRRGKIPAATDGSASSEPVVI